MGQTKANEKKNIYKNWKRTTFPLKNLFITMMELKIEQLMPWILCWMYKRLCTRDDGIWKTERYKSALIIISRY